MKHEKLAQALDAISDRHIAEAAGNRKKHRPYWLGGIAAALAVVILVAALGNPTVQAQGVIASPKYPEMVPYPNEPDYVNPVTGEFDNEGFSRVYDAWQESQKAQRPAGAGYADNLNGFFAAGIPTFLAGADGENRVFSPLNVYMALAMLAEATGGESRQQILALLRAPDAESLRAQAKAVWNAHYCDDSATTCLLAASLWLDEGMEYDQATVDTLARDYYASVYQGALGGDAANEALRNWLNENTGGLLEEQAGNLSLSPETVLALAASVYYRVKWSSAFSEAANTQGVFHAPAGDMETTYMNTALSYGPYCWGEDFGATYLSLEDGGKMWLVLPDEGYTPEDILQSGCAMDYILSYGSGTGNEKEMVVNLSLPKFDAASDMDLGEGLRSLGITDVFDAAVSDYSPILPQSEDIYLDTVSHAARVRIDEEGVEAAAYTVMAICGAGMPPEEEIDFVLDRPFLFVITSRDGLPLFAGIVNQP